MEQGCKAKYLALQIKVVYSILFVMCKLSTGQVDPARYPTVKRSPIIRKLKSVTNRLSRARPGNRLKRGLKGSID